MEIAVEVLVKVVRNIKKSTTSLQEEKLPVALSVQWRGAKLFLDSEPEGKAATPLGTCH